MSGSWSTFHPDLSVVPLHAYMSASSRGRGGPSRGRGVGRSSLSRQLSSDEEEGDASQRQQQQQAQTEDAQDDDGDTSMQRAPSRAESVASSSTSSSAAGIRQSLVNRAGPATPSATPGGTLLRKNVYTRGNKMKFMPNMVRRKAPVESVKLHISRKSSWLIATIFF